MTKLNDRPIGCNNRLSIQNLSTGYRGKVILDDVSIPDLHQGELVALVGPNAAGKTTLAKSIAGLQPATGTIDFNRQNLLKLDIRSRSRLLSYLPQDPLGYLELTVFEALVSAGRLRSKSTLDTLEARALELLEKLELVPIALEPLSKLSGGQRQMVGFAQAILEPCQILLLDEPINALDLRRQEQVMGYVRAMADEGCIIIMVLHDLAVAARWADKLVVLGDGQLKAYGTPHDVLSKQLLADLYGISADLDADDNGALRIHITGLSG